MQWNYITICGTADGRVSPEILAPSMIIWEKGDDNNLIEASAIEK